MNKNSRLIAVIYIILYLLYFVLSILLAVPKGAAFWISYLFAILAFTAVIASVVLAKGDKTEDAFFGLPLVIMGNAYLLVQLVLGIILMMVNPGAKLVVILELIPLAIYGVAAVGTILGRNVSENLEDETSEKIAYLQLLENTLQRCVGKCQDSDLRRQLTALQEAVHYSDPMSRSSLMELEAQLMNQANELEALVVSDPEAAKQQCRRLDEALQERNRRCLQEK